MANNYTPSYNQYRTQTAGYALPSSVRTYSVFDPASNSWRRMTNDGMSPMPQGNQPDIAGALAQARQTQGTVHPAQGMGQGQPVEVHPGYLNPPVQAPAQTPSQVPAQTPVGGPKTPSQPLPRGGAVPVQGQPSGASQRAVEAPAAVQAGNPYMGYAESRREFEDPDAFLHETPRGTAGAQGQRIPSVFVAQNEAPAEVQQMFQSQGRLIPQFDVDKADRPFLGHERDMLAQGFYRASDLANQGFQAYLGGAIAGPLLNLGKGVLIGRAAQAITPTSTGSFASYFERLPNIGGGLNKAREVPSHLANPLAAMRKPIPTTNTSTNAVVQKPIVINPNHTTPFSGLKPQGRTLQERYINAPLINSGQGYLSPYAQQFYNSHVGLPSIGFLIR